mmetsp:Transcript_33119/g.50776  ORF Transcript_33119/g.50776 Transcript_33119/m.50776 type:complete len:182 (-) Transcript_33119:8-553(-)
MLYIFNALSYFLLAMITLVALDTMGSKQKESQQRRTKPQSESIIESKPPTISLTLPSRGAPSDEEGLTVIADSEFDYDEEEESSDQKQRTVFKEVQKTSSFSSDSKKPFLGKGIEVAFMNVHNSSITESRAPKDLLNEVLLCTIFNQNFDESAEPRDSLRNSIPSNQQDGGPPQSFASQIN